jgi:DNA polymerase III epsilon subunit family exonuclease
VTTSELLHALHLDTFIALDLETTGLKPGTDGITEISAYKFVDGQPAEEYSHLINPGMKIPKEIVELTGITPEMVKDAPPITDILPELTDFIGDNPIVGHMIKFDISFLEFQYELAGRSFPDVKVYDTLILARTFLYFHHEFNLGGVSNFFGY